MNTKTEDSPSAVLDRNQGQDYWEERAILDFTEDVIDLMARRRISKAKLAKLMDCAPPLVSRLLAGNNNYTLKTMVRVARALNGHLKISLEANDLPQWEKVSFPQGSVATPQTLSGCTRKTRAALEYFCRAVGTNHEQESYETILSLGDLSLSR